MTKDQILDAKYRAEQVFENLTGAYWSEFHRKGLCELARDDFMKMADAFGFDVSPRHDPLNEAIPLENDQ